MNSQAELKACRQEIKRLHAVNREHCLQITRLETALAAALGEITRRVNADPVGQFEIGAALRDKREGRS